MNSESNKPAFGPVTNCQNCGAEPLESLFNLGYLPPVNTMTPVAAPFDAQAWFPAELKFCETCKLVQLGYEVDKAVLFPPSYPYTSGTTKILRDNFANLASEARGKGLFGDDDLVVDVGSNDGTLLAAFSALGARVVGVEPTNAAKLAQEKGITTFNEFLSRDVMQRIAETHGQASIVTAANVFAHIKDVSGVVDAVCDVLAPDGYFVSESHYLGAVVQGLQYDTIYHEHLRYYSFTSINNLLARKGFRAVHVVKIPTHGGSVRVYATRDQDAPIDLSVNQLLAEEKELGLASNTWAEAFSERVNSSKLDLLELIASVKRAKGRIVGIGAPSRASTLVNFTGIDSGMLDTVFEIKGSAKIGFYLPGTDIPIFDESALYEEQPSHALLLSWHIADELCRALKKRGFKGDFIVPLPEPHLVRNTDVSV